MPQPIHMLLVEDDEDDIFLFNVALKKQPTAVRLTTLTEGNKVLPYLETITELPNLILLDLNLPFMNGRDVLVQIKQSTTFRQLPVWILTTSSAQEDKDFCLANGAVAFFVKPVSQHELIALLGRVIRTIAG